MAVDLGTPSWVSHIGPVFLVKSRRTLKRRPVEVENEAFLVFIDCQDVPGNGEQLVAHSQNPSERNYRVCHTARRDVDHDFINLTQIVAVFFTDSPARVLAESTRRNSRPGSVCLILLGILDPPYLSLQNLLRAVEVVKRGTLTGQALAGIMVQGGQQRCDAGPADGMN
jgi:hypothetical protein